MPFPPDDPAVPRSHALKINEHKTSFKIENVFWSELRAIAGRRRTSITAVVREIAARPRPSSLVSAVRVAVVQDLQRRTAAAGRPGQGDRA